jgi:hypothetical protein
MTEEKKLHVYIVLEYDKDDKCKIVDVYYSRAAARARVIRLEFFQDTGAHNPTFHIIKKSVSGVKFSFELDSDKTIKQFYKIHLDKQGENNYGNDCASQTRSNRI